MEIKVDDMPRSNGTLHLYSEQCQFRAVCSVVFPGGFEAMCGYFVREPLNEKYVTVYRCTWPEKQR